MNDRTEPRSKKEKIERLRVRLDRAITIGGARELAHVLKGVLDLLDDEL